MITEDMGSRALSMLTLALLTGCAAALPREPPRPLTLDTHVDIPLDYMREARFDAGGDSVLQVTSPRCAVAGWMPRSW